MALTPRIVTERTRLFGALLFIAVVASVWIVAELAPQRIVPDEFDTVPAPPPDNTPAPYVTPDHLAFQPAEDPKEDELCGWTADQVWLHFDQLAMAKDVKPHTREVAELTEAYIDLGCPARVHRGDWHVNAEVLGVGLVYETLRGQARVYDPELTFDERADDLIPAAVFTFEVLAPTRMCKEAVTRHHGADPHGEHVDHAHLYNRCMAVFGR